ncbi:hypothetical protein F1559_003906 [Cyanidiococcus yangmingshanensis]|uniref:Uncharacterized protein n=1 Tax=Cyanidiococcus yangmingshanensis TaxID=2690220 RepID=A0A7J7IFC6_9RHOD|nr:hypothetical protein F1559_003906 [Cyanidiococcus yangmingshanensis]
MTWTLWTALYQALSGWVRRPNQALPLDSSGAPAAGSLGAAPELRSGGHETGIDGEFDGVRTYMGVHPIELGLYRDKEERETGGTAVTASSVPRVERLGEVASKEPGHSSALRVEKRFRGTAHLNGKRDRDNQTFFDSRPGLTLTRTALASGIVARVQHTTTATRSKPADRSRGADRSDSESPLWSRKKQSTTEYERLVRRLSRLESKAAADGAARWRRGSTSRIRYDPIIHRMAPTSGEERSWLRCFL